MFRPLWLALVALGLWASLIPQVTYPSASSGELSNDALIAWPGWGVQQDLGALGGNCRQLPDLGISGARRTRSEFACLSGRRIYP